VLSPEVWSVIEESIGWAYFTDKISREDLLAVYECKDRENFRLARLENNYSNAWEG
jgi:hypothetical protein